MKLQFHGAKLSSDGGQLLYRELDDTLRLSKMASWELRDNCTGKNRSHGKQDSQPATALTDYRRIVRKRRTGFEVR